MWSPCHKTKTVPTDRGPAANHLAVCTQLGEHHTVYESIKKLTISHMTHRIRERPLTKYWGGGSVLFQRLEPKNFSPSQVNSPKILAPFKMWAQKIVTLPCKKKIENSNVAPQETIRTLFWDNYFTGIRKKCHYLTHYLQNPVVHQVEGTRTINSPIVIK